MKAPDHYSKAERLEQQQASLDMATHNETIINGCYSAAYHFVCWAGDNHEQYGGDERRYSTLLKQIQAPNLIQSAWTHLAQLNTKALYGSGVHRSAANQARAHLATIKEWAESLHS